MSRVYNFSAGPAVLPEEVLKEVADEMMDYQGSGMSVMEMSHRSADFQKIIDEAEQDLRDLMKIPDNYKVLFLQGGASQQFAAIPMNLMKNKVADYIVTGQWAKKAYQEAQKYGKANKIASSEDKTFSYIPDCSDLPISPDADYVYICENNTIYGTKFKKLPNTKGKTLVADVSSCFLSEPVDVSKYGIIYGGVQFYVYKNSEGNWVINNGALQDSEISAYMEKQLSDSDVSALIKKVQNELDQAQQSDPSLEEFLNGLGEEAGVSTEAEDGTMLTASEECNVRAEASTDADILGVISAGDQVQKTGTDGEWVQIDYDGQTGYIRGDLLE